MSVEAGTVVGQDFKIVEPIASGGMGELYVAEQVSTGKRRALKLMKADLLHDSALVARFEQEAKVGSKIASDHVVEVVGAGVDETLKRPWMAMELLQGESVLTMVKRLGSIRPNEVRVLFAQLTHALSAAHRAGVIHRDLKPDNVFVARVNQLGVEFKVKVLDFGIAKLLEETKASQTGMMPLGTPLYMAPEQTGGQAITPRTDVWAMGLLAFHLLVGRPFWKRASSTDNSMMELMREVLFEPMVPATRRAGELGGGNRLPPGFDAWFAKCVAREQGERFADAQEAGAAFDRMMGAAVTTYPAGGYLPHGGATLASAQAPESQAGSTRVGDITPTRVPSLPSVPPAAGQSRLPETKLGRGALIAIVLGSLALLGASVGAFFLFTDGSSSRRSSDDDDDDRPRSSGEDDTRRKDLSATYDTKGSQPSGKGYAGTLTLSKRDKRGNQPGSENLYDVAWSNGSNGIGLRSGRTLGIAWGAGDFAVSVFDVGKDKMPGVGSSSSGKTLVKQELQGPENLDGTYVLVGEGGETVMLKITPSGDTYSVRPLDYDGTFEGIGLLQGSKFVVAWGQSDLGGVALYTENGSRLEGKWALRGSSRIGKEKAEPQ